MLILIGESGSGKSTIEKILKENYDYRKIVTYTTRNPRNGEINGVDYNFISPEEFLALKDSGFFVETATYNGWHYGTAKQDCTDDKIAILTPHGFRQVLRYAQQNNDLNIISFYIRVPRKDRLIRILKRGDNIEEAYRRNLSDVGMFDGVEDEVNYVIDGTKVARFIANRINSLYINAVNAHKTNI